MTDEALKIKIAGILQSKSFPQPPYIDLEIGYCPAISIAEALIDAGIGDVKEAEMERKAYEVASNQYRISFETEKYWREVAERALKDMCKEYEDAFECDSYKECDCDKPCYLCDYAERLLQAEKELAEERNDE